MKAEELEKLVPPRKLCERIAENVFQDSTLGWKCVMDISTTPPDVAWCVVPRHSAYCCGAPDAPAPTLEEILREMGKNPRYFNNGYCEIDGDGFIVGAWLPNLGNPGSTLVEYRDQNGATAALKLFLHDRREK